MIISALFFLTGVMLVQQLSVLPGLNYLLVLILLLIVFVRYRIWRLSLLVIGILWSVAVAMSQKAEILPDSLEGQEIVVQGMIDGLPVKDGDRIKFDFSVSRPEHHFPRKIRLSWYYSDQIVKAGQYWQLTVKLKKPHGRFNPGGFDYERWLFSHRIGATGYVRSKPVPELMTGNSWKQDFQIWRQSIAERIQHLAGDSTHAGIILALTIGDRSHISKQEWEVLRQSGTAHLVAISGLHVGLVAGLVYFLALKAWAYSGVLSFSPPKAAVLCALVAAFYYAALAGFSLPTQRALIMLSVAMAAIYWQRHMAVMQTVAAALFAVVVLDPLAVLSASFWLSFLAVVLIVYSLSARLGRIGYWHSVFKINSLTAVGLVPLIMFYFQQVSLIAPLANLLAVPVIGLLVVPLLLLTMITLMIHPLWAEFLLLSVDRILHWLWLFLSTCIELPFAALTTSQPSLFAVVMAMIGTFLLLAPKGISVRYLGGLLWLPLVFVKQDSIDSGEARLAMLDVGQGLAIAVETQHHTLIFDSGAKFSPQFDMGEVVVLPYLRYRGIKRIDTLLISHGDNDHSGGAESILASIPVTNIISDFPQLSTRYHTESCRSGLIWEWDGVHFSLLSPPEQDFFKTENDNSCVLKISTVGQSFLLTGDIERTAEAWLAKQYGNSLRSNVLIAPHHGSRSSSTLHFLQKVDPEVTLISAGYRNRFAFPHPSVLQRYRQLDISWLDSADEGAIIVNTESEKLVVESSREKFKKYWFLK